MKVCRFTHQGRTALGLVEDDEVVDLADRVPSDLGALLGDADDWRKRLERAAPGAGRIALAQVKLEAPIVRPPKFVAIGLNYADHIAETAAEAPKFPVFFNKQSTCVVGPGDPIRVPRVSSMVDYEGELGVVIGRRGRHVSAKQAPDAVAGFLVVNDVSVRDCQFRAPTMTLGKSFDSHGPIGPWLVTPDELADPHRLSIRTWVSGELLQDGNTSEMIYDVWQQIETMSTVWTLEPGDVLATGTPAGVGVARTPPRFLRAGDTVRIEIEGIGALENPVVDE